MKKLWFLWTPLACVFCGMLGLVIQSCNEETCLRNDRGYIGISCHNNDGGTDVALNELTVTAFDTDSVLINQESSVSSLSLPVDETRDSTVYVFKYTSTDAIISYDTLSIYYTRTPVYISMECGKAIYCNIEDVKYTAHQLARVEIVNKLIKETDAQNIKLYY
ncbi:MAG TPA: DUF6452 family protein [Bacteroidaceae bacterium]|nr:DUF6452 family protein [Bacteroidaceae bacterium]